MLTLFLGFVILLMHSQKRPYKADKKVQKNEKKLLTKHRENDILVLRDAKKSNAEMIFEN